MKKINILICIFCLLVVQNTAFLKEEEHIINIQLNKTALKKLMLEQYLSNQNNSESLTERIQTCKDTAADNSQDLDLTHYKNQCGIHVVDSIVQDIQEKIIGILLDNMPSDIERGFNIQESVVDFHGIKIYPIQNEFIKDLLTHHQDDPHIQYFIKEINQAQTREELKEILYTFVQSIQITLPELTQADKKELLSFLMKKEEDIAKQKKQQEEIEKQKKEQEEAIKRKKKEQEDRATAQKVMKLLSNKKTQKCLGVSWKDIQNIQKMPQKQRDSVLAILGVKIMGKLFTMDAECYQIIISIMG